MFLQSWWSRTYNRPMKDPLLADYTPEELMYEYLDHTARTEHAATIAQKQEEEQEDHKYDAAMQWAAEEEARDRELAAAKEKAKITSVEAKTPDLTPEDVKWMEGQLQQQKELLGDDFGEDFSGEF